ncbi:hypothetical protein MIND_00888300 [Mycena indigotica]|uniref:Uncharacterized protein n=1 Tax=Mycena indigotica TaxID=2126181 RepID=A0A8H6SHE1_9AGAR|nr:uncharacterized protein MIND_00888300 [Mycena indigotica]KAF7299389.1 hypothetical protein MIND_00888300 [Mycena indigotica]
MRLPIPGLVEAEAEVVVIGVEEGAGIVAGVQEGVVEDHLPLVAVPLLPLVDVALPPMTMTSTALVLRPHSVVVGHVHQNQTVLLGHPPAHRHPLKVIAVVHAHTLARAHRRLPAPTEETVASQPPTQEEHLAASKTLSESK